MRRSGRYRSCAPSTRGADGSLCGPAFRCACKSAGTAMVDLGRECPVGLGRHRRCPCRSQYYRCSGAWCRPCDCDHVAGALSASARRRGRLVRRARRGRRKRASVHVRALSRGFELTAVDTCWSGIPSHVRPHLSASSDADRKHPRHAGFCAAQQERGEAERH